MELINKKSKFPKELYPNFGMRRKKHNEETKKKISETNEGQVPWNKGIPCSNERKQSISKALKGVRKGVSFSEQHKINLSKALKGRVPGFLGKHWTERNKKKFSKLQIKRYQDPEYRKKISGENSPMWQGGISKLPYPFNFDKELKELIRKRDNYKCQLCGMPECENVKKLCIHHIDYDKKNCSPDNLITLCGSCNAKVNFNREYWTKYFRNKMEKD